MRVAFIESYPGWRGAQHSLAALVGSLSNRIDPEILCTVDGRSVEGFRQAGLPVRVVPVPRRLEAFGGALAGASLPARIDAVARGLLPFTLKLRRELAARRPDLVHCNQARGVLLAGAAAASLSIPMIWHLRGAIRLGFGADLAVHRFSSRIICVARALLEGLRPSARARAVVVHNGISPDERPAAGRVGAVRRRVDREKAERGLVPQAVILVTASSFVPHKGLHHLVEALEMLVRAEPGLSGRLLWVALGDSEGHREKQRYRNELLRRATLAGVAANLWLPGSTDEVPAWLAAADLTLLPTVGKERFRYSDGEEVEIESREGFPRTVLESMLVGTPVLASRVGGVAEQVVDGETGLIVPAGDPVILASGLRRLIDDPALRRRLGETGRERVEEFSVERMSERVLEIYAELLGHAGGRR